MLVLILKSWQPTPGFLPGESQGWRSLMGCRLWGHTASDTIEVTQQQQQLQFTNCTVFPKLLNSRNLNFLIINVELPQRLQGRLNEYEVLLSVSCYHYYYADKIVKLFTIWALYLIIQQSIIYICIKHGQYHEKSTVQAQGLCKSS